MAIVACTSDPCPAKLWENTIISAHQQSRQYPNRTLSTTSLAHVLHAIRANIQLGRLMQWCLAAGSTFQQTMGEIIERFYQNQNVFMLELVIQLLERSSIDRTLNLPADWLISKLLQTSNPIPKDRLFDAYSSLIKVRTSNAAAAVAAVAHARGARDLHHGDRTRSKMSRRAWRTRCGSSQASGSRKRGTTRCRPATCAVVAANCKSSRTHSVT